MGKQRVDEDRIKDSKGISQVLISGGSAICYNKSIMVKKLRTRELLSDTDHEEDGRTALPVIASIRPAAIRHKLSTQRSSNNNIRTQRAASNFKRRFLSRVLGEIMSQGEFECPICLELMVSPVMMGCGHVFCFRCLESNAAYNERCCLCRTDQHGLPHIPLRFAQTLIERFLLPSGPDLLRYLCRTTDSAEWAKRRRVGNYRMGLVVDFQDRSNIWRRGVIVNTSEAGFVEVRSNVKDVETFEKVEISSRRLAPYTFFTRSRYLEDFPPCLPEHDRTQAELNKLEFRAHWSEEGGFNFPEQEREDGQVEAEVVWEQEDEAMRIFRAEMNEIDLILDF